MSVTASMPPLVQPTYQGHSTKVRQSPLKHTKVHPSAALGFCSAPGGQEPEALQVRAGHRGPHQQDCDFKVWPTAGARGPMRMPKLSENTVKYFAFNIFFGVLISFAFRCFLLSFRCLHVSCTTKTF